MVFAHCWAVLALLLTSARELCLLMRVGRVFYRDTKQ